MGFYSPMKQGVNINFEDRFDLREEVDSLLEDIQEGEMQNHIDNVMVSPIGRRIIKGLLEEGYSRKEVEQMFMEAAKKSKKKKDKKSKDKDSDIDIDDIGNSSDIPKTDDSDDSKSDDDKDSKKKDKKSKDKDSKDDSSDDDLDLDDSSDDKDSDESKSDDKDSKKKDKKDKKSKDKDSKDDSTDDIDDESIEDKSDTKKSKKSKDSKNDDDNESNDKDSKKKSKKDKKSKDDSSDDDLKLEQVDYNVFTTSRSYKPNFRSMLEDAMDKEYKIKSINECDLKDSSSKAKSIKTGKQRVKEMKGVKENFRWRLPSDYIPPVKNKYWDKIVREFFDMSDDKTRVVLITCNEDAQSEVLHSLTDRLYDVIVDKSATIDYGTIDESRGDIQALQNYGKLEECVELLHQLLIECKQDTNPVDEIKMAMDNLANRADMFRKCYMSKVDFGILTYETMTLAVVASTSLMLCTSVEFIKSANNEDFQISLDRTGMAKAKNHLLFNNLKRFNVMCDDKSFDKTMDTILIEYGRNLIGLSTMSGLAVAALVTVVLYNFLPMLRELTYFFYYTKTRLSDYFNLQADLLEMNAHDIEVNQRPTVGDRKTVVKRQRAIAEKFRSIADFFMVDSRQAEQKAISDVNRDRQKLKTDDVMDDIPDNSKSALF